MIQAPTLATPPPRELFTSRLAGAPDGCTREVYGPVEGWVLKYDWCGSVVNVREYENAIDNREIVESLGARIPVTILDDNPEYLYMEFIEGTHPKAHYRIGSFDCNCKDLQLKKCYLTIVGQIKEETNLTDLHHENVLAFNGELWIIDLGNGTY